MDLLRELAGKINVTYDLRLSPDGQFGSYMVKNNSGMFFPAEILSKLHSTHVIPSCFIYSY